MRERINIFWFRRDFRLDDNTGLFHALNAEFPVLPIFIFDKNILDKLNQDDARVTFIYQRILQIKEQLENRDSSLLVYYDAPINVFKKLITEYDIQSVFANKDYEPFARERDEKINSLLEASGVKFQTFKDHVIFEENEILKDSGEPYTIFTPYSKKWKSVQGDNEIKGFPSEQKLRNLIKIAPFDLPELNKIGFKASKIQIPEPNISKELITNYALKRDIPAETGTSRLGVHLRFGTVSIRKVTQLARNLSEVFLNELIWRNFFIDILWHFPHVVNKSFKPKYDLIQWRNNEDEFEKWSRGVTGYPFVDAGMRELNATGFMHNRVRMVTASFLTKHLLIDWRWGEAYFAEKLLDFELASNNGNWQWAAGTGCDAAPYFRIFNPESQQKKFDPESNYISKWIPEYGTLQYPHPIIDHSFARERALKVYSEALR